MFHRRKSGTGSDPPGLLFLPARGNPDHPDISDALLFLSVSPWAEKDKEAKRNLSTHRIFSQAPHSFFSKSTRKNGQVARLNLTVLRTISTPSGRIPRKSLA